MDRLAPRPLHQIVQRGRSERGGEAYRVPVALLDATGESYVEPPSDAIDPLQQREQRVPRLAAFFNILPVPAP